eukprot:793698-Pelagomonas_calceolata.AAC.2
MLVHACCVLEYKNRVLLAAAADAAVRAMPRLAPQVCGCVCTLALAYVYVWVLAIACNITQENKDLCRPAGARPGCTWRAKQERSRNAITVAVATIALA